MANGLATQALLANINRNLLEGMYGKDSGLWRGAGAATLIGAEIAEGYNKWANASLKSESIEARQQEISSRADATISLLAQESKAVQAVQETAFAKAGVKLEGSAIDVVAETAVKAMEAAKARRREADFQVASMEVEKALQDVTAKYAPINTLLNIGAIGAGTAMEAKAFAPQPNLSKKGNI